MALLEDPQITPQERAELNEAFRLTPIDRSEARALGDRFGVSANTVLGWTRNKDAIPRAAEGQSASDLPKEWRERVWLARSLIGEARSDSRYHGKSSSYDSKTRGSLDRVMKRIADYHNYRIDRYRNEAWRRLTVKIKKGKWVIEVEYERIPSPEE